MSSKDYTNKFVYTIIIVSFIMLGIMFIPSYSLGNIKIKRANILSDIICFDDELDSKQKNNNEPILSTDSTFINELPASIKDLLPDEKTADNKITSKYTSTNINLDTSYIQIEDYSHDSMMYKFYRSLNKNSKDNLIRIGVCGDSYIEADIITADLRELLQNQYGGQGVGFVPFSHPLLKYRSTIASSSIGWIDYSAMKRKMIPENLDHSMYISGCFSVPSDENARCYFKGSNKRKFISFARSAKIIYQSHAENEMSISINDSIYKEVKIYPNNEVQCIEIDTADIHSLSLSLREKDNFIGYGICFDGKTGIAVDNYSIRGNSGLCLFYSNNNVNSKINSYLHYNLIILQYGLNIMSDEITNYTSYKDKLKKIIRYIRICFPESAVLIMGVSDRGKNENGTIRSMHGIPYLITAQREAAIETGTAFWDTFKAMGGNRAIVRFVEKGWASKDYTHINYNGGKYIADQLFTSITNESNKIKTRELLQNIIPVKRELPTKVESPNEKITHIICSHDKSRHKFVSRRYGKKLNKW